MSVSVIAIDPGPEKSAWVVWDGERVILSSWCENFHVLDILARGNAPDLEGLNLAPRALIIERVVPYRVTFGEPLLETVYWSGRFAQAWLDNTNGWPVHRLSFPEVRKHFECPPRSKESHIWLALQDRFGPPGTKKAPGVLYGIRSHERSALAVAVTWWDQKEGIR